MDRRRADSGQTFSIEYITLLMDFYSSLLTGHTASILMLYYGEDLSLSEIADDLGVSRQSVHDTLRRGVKALSEYEQKMGLIERQNQRGALIRTIDRALASRQYEQAAEAVQALAAFEAIGSSDNR